MLVVSNRAVRCIHNKRLAMPAWDGAPTTQSAPCRLPSRRRLGAGRPQSQATGGSVQTEPKRVEDHASGTNTYRSTTNSLSTVLTNVFEPRGSEVRETENICRGRPVRDREYLVWVRLYLSRGEPRARRNRPRTPRTRRSLPQTTR